MTENFILAWFAVSAVFYFVFAKKHKDNDFGKHGAGIICVALVPLWIILHIIVNFFERKKSWMSGKNWFLDGIVDGISTSFNYTENKDTHGKKDS